ERPMTELEVEPGGLGGPHSFAFDPLAHPAHLDGPVDRDAVGWVRDVAGGQLEAPPKRRVARDGARPEQRLRLPRFGVALPVLQEPGDRTRERPVAPLRPESGVDLPSLVAHRLEDAP